ncbi:hypothetical protein BDZ94DRAFT_707496 [Collybia nuda]|uniref:Uncharacterized protein n=1 Tax=Collybia nuda TaxID=64659 RepID=A0A9P5Y5U2_9AGAR|nr:hypothetical protein BDZ94DRAFT_707496 [Collybia nuda]
MPPFPFSALAEKLENAYEAIHSALVLFPDGSDEQSVVGSVWFTVARDQCQDSPLRLRNGSSSFSSEETDNSGSFRSMEEDEVASYNMNNNSSSSTAIGATYTYTPQTVYGGKILPNIADFDDEDDSGVDTDTDSFYTTESSEGLAKALQSSLSIATQPPIIASDGQHYFTVLPPPPRRKYETNGKLIFVPSDAPGTCPIHGCAGDPCSTCKFKDRPMLFSF